MPENVTEEIETNGNILEQNINFSKILSAEDNVNLQQYITREYGTLTTFNVLFPALS